jgi:hypothetical protein
MTLKQADPLFTEQYGVTVPDGVELTEWV